MDSATRQSLLFLAAIVAVVVVTISLVSLFNQNQTNRVSFSLTSHSGETITADDLAGRHLVVFFGFTSCPDICPTQMFKLGQLVEHLEAQRSTRQIVPLFISIDPERDTEQKLASYLKQFHEHIIGLTGSREELALATDSFGTLLAEPAENPDENYMLMHSSLFYVIDPFGRIVEHIPATARIEDMLQTINKML